MKKVLCPILSLATCDRSNFTVTMFQKQTPQTKFGSDPKEAGIVLEKPQSQLQEEAVACSSNGRRGDRPQEAQQES